MRGRLLLLLTVLALIAGCSKRGEAIRSLTIGKQVWMAENLTTDKYRNGDFIRHTKSVEEWHDAISRQESAWCNDGNESGEVGGFTTGSSLTICAALHPKGGTCRPMPNGGNAKRRPMAGASRQILPEVATALASFSEREARHCSGRPRHRERSAPGAAKSAKRVASCNECTSRKGYGCRCGA